MIYIYVFIYHKPYIMRMSYHDATGGLVITGRAYHLSIYIHIYIRGTTRSRRGGLPCFFF